MEQQFTSAMVDVRGVPLHVLEGGSGEPLLVLHPSGGAGLWQAHHDLLAQSYRVIAPDHPGFGKSPTTSSVDTVEDIALLYASMLDGMGIDQCFVLGSSFGGWVAAELAFMDWRRIKSLALVAALGLRIPGFPTADLFAMNPQQKMAALFRDPEAAAAAFPAEPSIDEIMAMFRDESAFARYAWEPFCCNPRLEKRLHRIASPTLIVWGDADKVVPLEHGRRYVSELPNARLEVLADTGHAVLFDRPDECVQLINDFFRV